MEKLNIYLNRIIALLVIIFILLISFNAIEPLFYNNNSVGKTIENYDNYSKIAYAFNTYLNLYKKSDLSSLKKCTALLKRQDEKKYEDVYTNIFKDKNISSRINNISKKINNVYIIDYTLNVNLENESNHKLIVKIYNIKNTFSIYYDSLIDDI